MKKYIFLLFTVMMGALSLYGEEKVSQCTNRQMAAFADSMLGNDKDMKEALDTWEKLGCPGTTATTPEECKALRAQFARCAEERFDLINK